MSWEARCAELEAVIADQQRVISALESMIETLRDQQAALVEAQVARIAELVSRVAELEARLKQDSQNSSQPPSRDVGIVVCVVPKSVRPVRARVDAGDGEPRSPGKQPGAPGSTLARRDPDVTVTHRPDACRGCGAGLDDAPVTGCATRQVLDIPRPVRDCQDFCVSGVV